MNPWPRLASAALIWTVAAAPLAGQSAPAAPPSAGDRPPASPVQGAAVDGRPVAPAPPGVLATGAMVGAGVGLLTGGVAGLMIGGNTCGDSGQPDTCLGLQGLYLGLQAGAALGAPLGAHVANEGGGSFARSALLTAAVTAGSLALVRGIGSRDVAVGVAFVLPLSHVLSSVAVERSTTPETR